MQKLFVVKEVTNPEDKNGNIGQVNEFIGKSGFIVNIIPFGITSSSGGESNQNNDRIAGRCLVVADDGKGDHDGLLP